MANPVIDWQLGKVITWNPKCHESCYSLFLPSATLFPKDLPEYLSDFYDVFSDTKCETLSPRQLYDCPIDLVPYSSLCKSRIYNITDLEC